MALQCCQRVKAEGPGRSDGASLLLPHTQSLWPPASGTAGSHYPSHLLLPVVETGQLFPDGTCIGVRERRETVKVLTGLCLERTDSHLREFLFGLLE